MDFLCNNERQMWTVALISAALNVASALKCYGGYALYSGAGNLLSDTARSLIVDDNASVVSCLRYRESCTNTQYGQMCTQQPGAELIEIYTSSSMACELYAGTRYECSPNALALTPLPYYQSINFI